MWVIVLCVVAGVGVLSVLGVGVFLATWRLSRPVVEGVEPDGIPPERFEKLRPLAGKLGAAGLVYAGLQRERRGRAYEAWQALFRNAEGSIWAVAECVGKRAPRVVLHSFFQSGRSVTTSQGEFADYNVTGDWRLTEQLWPDFESQVKHHRQVVLGAGADLVALDDADGFRGWYHATANAQFEQLQASGFLVASAGEPGRFKVRPLRSPGIALKMLLHTRRNKWAEKSRQRDADFQKRLDAEAEERKRYGGLGEYTYLQHYKRHQERGNTLVLMGWTAKGAILFFSILALIVIALARGSIGSETAAVIAGVLVLHELGHVAMMMCFGYRDLHVLFLPGVGRLAPERHLRVSAWKEFLVLLMGPLPGLLLGWALLGWAYFNPNLPEVWKTVGFWAALINNLNFLPVLPYDGGRVVNLLIFERVPALRLIYLIGSSLAVLALALVSWLVAGHPPIILLVILISAFIAIPDNWRMARMAPWARHNLSPDDSETDALMKAFQIVEQTDSVKGLEKFGWVNFVDRIVRYGCSRKLGFFGTVGCLVLFFSFLFAPVWTMAGVAIGDKVGIEAREAEVARRIEELEPKVNWPQKPLGAVTRKVLDALLADTRDGLAIGRLAGTTGEEGPPGAAVTRFEGISMPAPASGSVGKEFDPAPFIRRIRWNEAASWAAGEESALREQVLIEAFQAQVGWFEAAWDGGERETALSDASKAYYACMSWAPRTSLGARLDWYHHEDRLLQGLLEADQEGPLPSRYRQWFAGSVRRRSPPQGRELALVLLRELQMGAENLRLAPLKRNPRGGLDIPSTPLRRCEADAPFREDEDLRPNDLVSAFGLVRLVQGRPTRHDLGSGLIVAAHWAGHAVVDSIPSELIIDDEQRKRWEARLDLIRSLEERRRLVVTQFSRPPRRGGAGILPLSSN